MISGDFNIIRNDNERRRGNPRGVSAMEDFNTFTDSYGLMESLHIGRPFSWCNGHKGRTWRWARLDRTLNNVSCLEGYLNISMKYLAKNSSDHVPLIISSEALVTRYGPTLIKFQQMWTTHEDFLRRVVKAWDMEVVGLGL